HEALHRMMESQWLEFVGRRDPGEAAPTAPLTSAPRRGRALAREFLAVAAGLVMLAGLVVGGRFVPRPAPVRSAAQDVFVAAQLRDLRKVLELYRREHGVYPD